MTVLAYAVPREAQDTLQRSRATQEAQPQRHTAPRTLPSFADVAQSLSRAGLASAKAELCTAALQKVVELAFVVDTDGRYANVDLDGRLLFALPFGKSGHKQWGLRRREAETLRAILMARQVPQQGRALPLFVYDHVSRSWYLNVADYPTEAQAVAYVRQFGIASREYKTALERLQTADRQTAEARRKAPKR